MKRFDKSYQMLVLVAFLVLTVAPSSMGQSAAPGEWTWVAGSNQVPGFLGGQPGVYGTLGTAASGNSPGGRAQGCTWTDKSGNFWLFGGQGYDGTGTWGYLNDLWMRSATTGQWTWMAGGKAVPASSKGNLSVYGTLQIPAEGNTPGGRQRSVCWTGLDGNFWLFGGQGFDAAGTLGELNDFWKYNTSTSEWDWMGGSTTISPTWFGVAGVYGTLGVASAANFPGSRLSGAGWTDSKGNLWLYGGYGNDENNLIGTLNDLWEFSPTAGEWTWMGGASTLPLVSYALPPVYGTLGTAAAGNSPGSRDLALTWTDAQGNLWLFGGFGPGPQSQSQWMNDLWEYRIASGEWAWMGGSSTYVVLGPYGFLGEPGIYGASGVSGTGNIPGSRYEPAGWVDQNGNMWLMGGDGVDATFNWGPLNDLWEYQPGAGAWTWRSGSENLPGQSGSIPGIYGTQGSAAAGNVPGNREGSVSWTDRKGNLWLFGGVGNDANGQYGYLNDLWAYVPPSSATLPQIAAPSITPAPGTYTTIQTVLIDDATAGASIQYSLNGGAMTPYTGAITVGATTTISAVASETGYTSNSIGGIFTINLPTVATPVFSLAPGTYSGTQTVSISDATAGATIYYSTNGPATTNSTVYKGSISVGASETIEAIAAEYNYSTSAAAATAYVIWPSTANLEWAWMGGSSTGSEPQVTGTKGTPAIGNNPVSRYQAVSWTDESGNFWLFGGDGDILSGGIDHNLNDLWEYSPSTHEWAWIAGNSMVGQGGIYGKMGVTSAGSFPGGRQGASGWTDNNGNLWLFGGNGQDANGTFAILNDLWMFNPSTREWTWMNGNSTVSNCFLSGSTNCAVAATYGTFGVAAAGNTPGSREGAITWTDSNGNLWLFGGRSFDETAQVQYYFNELWEYNTTTNQWAMRGGSNATNGAQCDWNVNLWYTSCGLPGVYGTKGTPASSNIPGGRSYAASWTDRSGNLWIFSGMGLDSYGNIGDLQDLWEFNANTSQWTWMGGLNTLVTDYYCDSTYWESSCGGPPVYGDLGVAAAGNIPPSRDHAVTWRDNNGDLWLDGGGFEGVPNAIGNGGWGMNDLWKLDPTTSQWAFMGGNVKPFCGIYCSSNLVGVHGQFQTPAPGNNPGSRFGAAGWTDGNGDFWLFGGQPDLTEGAALYDNDLWEYQPSNGTLPTSATPLFSVQPGTYASSQNVAIGDSTNGAYIYYTTDGSTPTINSLIFTPSISQPINIQHSETLQAIALTPGCFPSAVATAVYTLPPQAATPALSLGTGTYTSFQTLTISDATPGATIYYTLNETTPTTSSSVYTGPIQIVNAYTRVLAFATASGYSPSNAASADYTLNLPSTSAPILSLASGTYSTAQTLTISDATPGATIYYQLNGGYPTTNSPVYTGPITVSSSETIWVMAAAPNYFGSTYVGTSYTINLNNARSSMQRKPDVLQTC